MKKILFVCTGNTCRSCMAEAYFKHIIKENEINDIHVDSAGLSVYNSSSASNEAIIVSQENGFNLSHHKSKQLTPFMLDDANLILTMTSAHKDIINHSFLKYKEKIFTLKEYIQQSGDIQDPYGLPIEYYRECFSQIKECIDKIIENR